MAKAKDLAALAGLAGLAYAYNKSKDKGTTDSNPTRAARPESTETRLKSPTESIAAADKSDKSTSISTKGAYGTTTPGTDKSVPNLNVKPAPAPAPVAKSVPKPAVAADNATEDSQSSLTTPVSSANRTDQLTNLSRAVKREDKTKKAAQADFKDVTRAASGDSPTAIKAKKLYDALDEKAGAATSSAQKTDALRVASRAAAAADRQRKLAKASSYKSGGMASSASSRADGIASRGKTKCKMY